MDAAVLAIWVLRLIFLAMLYAFLWMVVRALVRDLRAAAREPTTELGRLVVVASPSGEPAAGRGVRARRDHLARARRQQLDRARGRVRLRRPTPR